MKAANNRNLCAISDMDNSCNLPFLLAMTVTQITREPYFFHLGLRFNLWYTSLRPPCGPKPLLTIIR